MRCFSHALLALAAVVAVSCSPAPDATETPSSGPASALYSIETVAERLDHPWSIAFLPGGDMLVTERAGWLRRIRDGVLEASPVPGTPAVHAESQGGLFDVALHPDFARNQLIYLSYAHGDSGANATRVARARYDGEALNGLEVIFEARPAKNTDVHYGGRLGFLPDGTLLVTLGDGFDLREQAQDQASLLGKIVRIADDGSVPADNPFVNTPDAAPEIYSLGHRNVQGLAVDAATGRVWAHEHGPRGGDELNLIKPGVNYGWPIATRGLDYSGARISPFETYDGMEDARRVWTPSIAPAGLALYSGDAFPQWRGDLFVAALVSGDVRRLEMEGERVVDEESLFAEVGERIRDVRMGPDGALYLLTDSYQGAVLRVTPVSR